MLELSDHKRDEVRVVSLDGKLEVLSSKTLLERLNTLIDGGERRVLLECSRLEYISSSGLRVVLMAAQRLEQLGGKLVLAGLSGPIRRIFNVAGFTSILTICDSLEAALEAVRQ